MANCIDRAVLMGQLTSAEMQQKLKQASGSEAYNEFLLLVNSAPAADVVPVVRCEQCVHGYDDIDGRHCACVDGPVRDNFFCYYGERNEVT